jgi:hypothetical protein
MATGIASGSAAQSGSRSRIFAIVSEMVSPGKAAWPVNISNSTQPNAQMSVRLSTVSPRACSGLMYAAVPRTTPARVPTAVTVGAFIDSGAPEAPSTLASPKSSTFTVPAGRALMFAGFRSRWMMACSCAASNASAICFAMERASVSDIAPRARPPTGPHPRRVP